MFIGIRRKAETEREKRELVGRGWFVESSGVRDTFLHAPALSHKKRNNKKRNKKEKKEKKKKENRKPK